MLLTITALAGGLAALSATIVQAIIRFLTGPQVSPVATLQMLEQNQMSLKRHSDLIALEAERIAHPRIALARLSELQEGNAMIFTDYLMQPAILVKTGERSCIARSAVCTHLGCTVQPDLVDGKIFCACHMSYFAVSDGAPLQGPATAPLAEEPLAILGDTVYMLRPEQPILIGPGQIPMTPA